MSPVVEALRQGALLLAANRRLARHWRKVFDDAQIADGQSAWESPAIRTWQDWVGEQTAQALPDRILPSPMAERRAWLRIITDAGDHDPLLDARATAAAAAEAWSLCRRYGLSLRHPAFDDSEDTRQFAKWALQFERRIEQRRWMPAADAEAWLADSMPELTREIFLDGFDDTTPVQERIFRSMSRTTRIHPAERPNHASLHRSANKREGLITAARWARTLLEDGQARNIGIVVHDLAGNRPAIESIFRDTLGAPLFNISLGRPLRDWPVVDTALGLLHWIARPQPLGRAGALLRSPYRTGGVETAERDLRERNRMHMTLAEAGWPAAGADAVAPRTPGAWARFIPPLLRRFGWPGERTLSSEERQAIARWEQVLRELAALDIVEGRMGFGEMLRLLDELTAEAIFQPETGDMPIHILEALQAAGSQFDALWVAGLTDGVWPPPARPHPLIPRTLQRQNDLPHSSPEREFRIATQLTSRLFRTAPEVIFDVPLRDGEIELRPSHLLSDLPRWGGEPREFPTAASVQFGRGEWEELSDVTGPPLGEERITAGTAILGWQALCPFRAFAQARLGAEAWREPEPGIPPAERGSALHDAIASFWRHFKSLARARAAGLEEIDRVLDASVDAIAIPGGAALADVERACLRKRLLQMVELDFTRDDFTVEETEHAVTLRGAGIPLRGRIDRIDRLPSGERIVIDYKSTAPSPSVWFGERPDNPQLPLYAIALDPPPAAIAFAHLKTGEVKFVGAAEKDELLPGTKSCDWPATLDAWRRVTKAMWDEFAQGHAAVTPKNGGKPCGKCHLHSLCRVESMGPEEDSDDAA